MRTIGSQKRETLAEAEYELIGIFNGDAGTIAVVRPIHEKHEKHGKTELWAKNDDFAGYVMEINGVGYAFICSI